MITRIVRMSFEPETTDQFQEIFNHSKLKIRAMQGCKYLSLHQDHHLSNVFYTISKWDSQEDLDNYRKSEVFEATWAKTKVLFNDKPMAHSLEEIDVII